MKEIEDFLAKLEAKQLKREAEIIKAINKQFAGVNFNQLMALILVDDDARETLSRAKEINETITKITSGLATPDQAIRDVFNLMTAEANRSASALVAIAADKPEIAGMLAVKPERALQLQAIANHDFYSYWQAESTRFKAEVKELTVQALERGMSVDILEVQLKERLNISKRRARLIAINEVSNAVSRAHEATQTELGITQYTWYSAGDRRVREKHRERHGKIFLWSKPPKEEKIDGHPGRPIRCRCVALPVIDNAADAKIKEEIKAIRAQREEEQKRQQEEKRARKANQNTKPVSGSLRMTGTSKEYDRAKETLAIIDSVHTDGKLTEIPFSMENLGDGTHGMFRSAFVTKRESKSYDIRLNPNGDTPFMTLTHEIGHWLHNDALGTSTGYWDNVDEGLKEVVRLAQESREIQEINHHFMLAGLKKKQTRGKERKNWEEYHDHLEYLLRKREIWARVYAQYITLRSGSPIMRDELERSLQRQKEGYPPTQWADESFAPIAEKIDILFRGKGWIE